MNLKIGNLLFLISFFALFSCSSGTDNVIDNKPEEKDTAFGDITASDLLKISDRDVSTYFESSESAVNIVLENKSQNEISAYSLYSANSAVSKDPVRWTVYGSNDNVSWTEIDSQKEISFCARFQQDYFLLASKAAFQFFKFEIHATDKVRISEIELHNEDLYAQWHTFNYPIVKFVNEAPSSKGSDYYDLLVDNKKEYLKWHALEVAKFLYASAADVKDVKMLTYTLCDYPGISEKSGNSSHSYIKFSTRHVEKTYTSSISKLSYETRGVLFHELTHCYQYEPKNCGTYDGHSDFWSFLEGVADAVRIQAGYHPLSNRQIGGWYSDGYQTTGFFLNWLLTKDPDAIRKFNKSADVLDTWSYDGAMKYIFGEQATARALWIEYQNYLKSI